jgi:hypothetical protein
VVSLVERHPEGGPVEPDFFLGHVLAADPLDFLFLPLLLQFAEVFLFLPAQLVLVPLGAALLADRVVVEFAELVVPGLLPDLLLAADVVD